MARLLFVDDDRDILTASQVYFGRLGHQVSCAAHADVALEIISAATLDCIILDIGMPNLNGFELCRQIREQTGVPIIFLSGLSEMDNRIKSFQMGGDDFLSKPYDVRELELRIQARIREHHKVFPSKSLRFGKLLIDTNRRIVQYGDRIGDFSTLQFDVLAFLAESPGTVFSYEQLYDRVWKTPIVGSRHNLQVTVATVRQKLAALCGDENYILTVPRKGYSFTPDPS